jgi:hypothetical protein
MGSPIRDAGRALPWKRNQIMSRAVNHQTLSHRCVSRRGIVAGLARLRAPVPTMMSAAEIAAIEPAYRAAPASVSSNKAAASRSRQ